MDTTTPTIATSLHTPSPLDDDHILDVAYDIQHGSTTIVRTAQQAMREELFMERSRTRRMTKVLREQLGRAQRRRSKKTLVPVELLDALLTRVETSDA